MNKDKERVERIRNYRFERGLLDAELGEPPTEASPEYQKGYQEGVRKQRQGRFVRRFWLP